MLLYDDDELSAESWFADFDVDEDGSWKKAVTSVLSVLSSSSAK